jgi:hypothetical protein
VNQVPVPGSLTHGQDLRGRAWRRSDCRLRDDRAPRTLVDREAEDVGPGVVAHDVEVVLALGDLPEVEVGAQDRFALGVRAGEDLAERRDDVLQTSK